MRPATMTLLGASRCGVIVRPAVEAHLISSNSTTLKSLRSLLILLLVNLGLTQKALAAASFIQEHVGLGSTPQRVAAADTSAQAVGDLNSVFIVCMGTTVHVQSITDSPGSSYAAAVVGDEATLLFNANSSNASPDVTADNGRVTAAFVDEGGRSLDSNAQ
jgi:hypothetical protein